MRVPAAVLVVSLACVLLALSAGSSAAAPTDANINFDDRVDAPSQSTHILQDAQTAQNALQEDELNESPRQTLQIQLTDDGHAEWTVSTEYELEDENEQAAFEELVTELQDGTATVGYSAATFENYAINASEATGREMEITDESWDGTVEEDTGTLELTFTWTNFAEKSGDRILLGDVFEGTDGTTWLPEIRDEQELVIVAPGGYAVDTFSLQRPPDGGFEDSTARWMGPVTFEAGDIQITYVATNGNGGGPGDTDTEGFSTVALVGSGAVLLVVVLAVAMLMIRGRLDEGVPVPAVLANDGGSATETATEASDDVVDGPADAATGTATDGSSLPGEQRSGDSADTTNDAAEAGAANATPTNDVDEGPDDDEETREHEGEETREHEEQIDPELLSDEERVLRLIEGNGGRMKQANIVSETGWSNAKVSQLLSAMDEDDQIDKLRIGRENLISLPDEELTDSE